MVIRGPSLGFFKVPARGERGHRGKGWGPGVCSNRARERRRRRLRARAGGARRGRAGSRGRAVDASPMSVPRRREGWWWWQRGTPVVGAGAGREEPEKVLGGG